MKNKLIIFAIIVVAFGILFFSTGRARTDVLLINFDVSADRKIMTMKVGVSGSAGYIRKMKKTSGSLNPYLTFYSTFGINSKFGANDTYTLELDDNMDEIYFYKGDNGYRKVLQKDKESGEWYKVVEKVRVNSLTDEEVSLIKVLAPTGFAGSSLNRIELYENGDVYWVQYDGAGLDDENIVKDLLVANNAKDIKVVDDEGISIVGDNINVIDDLEIGWLMFNK